ncbi:MAG TPA: hypothetical protein VMF52_01155 [Steroidobacteraceae bacterium]|nr:hypothetical protein [Steroidobacteraceae bacterium]
MRTLGRVAEFAPLLMILSGCHPDVPAKPARVVSPDQSVQRIIGTMHLLWIEGGCWVIETNTGRIQPLGLPEEFKLEGLVVRATVREARNVMTACQVGALRQVESMEKLR